MISFNLYYILLIYFHKHCFFQQTHKYPGMQITIFILCMRCTAFIQYKASVFFRFRICLSIKFRIGIDFIGLIRFILFTEVLIFRNVEGWDIKIKINFWFIFFFLLGLPCFYFVVSVLLDDVKSCLYNYGPHYKYC